MFEKIMYKVKDNVFRIRDFTSGDKVDESKFIEATNQRGAPQLQTPVCVMYKDEYNSLKQEIESSKHHVLTLSSQINDYDSKIEELEKKLHEKKQTNIDEVIQLKEDISNIKQERIEEIKKLESVHANEILELEKAHHQEILDLKEELSQTKQDNLQAMREKDKIHNDEVEKIRNSFLKLLVTENTEDVSQLLELEDLPFYIRPFVRKHINKIREMKERKLSNSPQAIISTYEK